MFLALRRHFLSLKIVLSAFYEEEISTSTPATGNELEEKVNMAAQIAVLISLNLFFSNIRLSQASTHWVVTEDGKVQAQVIVILIVTYKNVKNCV